MPTPSEELYAAKRQDRLAKKREGMRKYREENPESVRRVNRKAYIKNREKIIAHVAKWVGNNRARYAATQRKCHLRANYGITPEEYDSLFLAQGKECPICKQLKPTGKNPWDVDHDHRTGKVRGILCHHCNVLLGQAKDNPDILRSAIAYLLIDRP